MEETSRDAPLGYIVQDHVYQITLNVDLYACVCVLGRDREEGIVTRLQGGGGGYVIKMELAHGYLDSW